MLGAVLLCGVWLLWPGPAHRGLDQPSAGGPDRQSVAKADVSHGLVAAAQAGVAISAKRQLVGEAAVVQHRLKQRLEQVAKTMPDIGMPDRAGERPTPTAATVPAEPLAYVAATAAGSVALAGKEPPDELGAADALPAALTVAPRPLPAPRTTSATLERERAPSGAPLPGEASAVAAGARVATVVEAAPAPVAPDAIMPAAASTAPEALQGATRTVALLDARPEILSDEPGPQRTPTWLRNAVVTVVDQRPAIAVVIDDLGLNRRGTAALNRLRAPLTLAFLPYATDLDAQTRAARAAGHELLVHVPMEPRSQDWPGPNALTAQLGPADLVSRLRAHLRSFRGFVGINNHMGSLLTTDPARMDILMAELRQRDLLFLDSRTTSESIAARRAERMQVPFAERDVFIDNDLDLYSVLRELARLENIARRRGHAVAIGHPHAVTIEALKRWLPALDARGIALVPISAIVARQSCASGVILVGNACARYAVAETTVQ
jgi:hypothetical protein